MAAGPRRFGTMAKCRIVRARATNGRSPTRWWCLRRSQEHPTKNMQGLRPRPSILEVIRNRFNIRFDSWRQPRVVLQVFLVFCLVRYFAGSAIVTADDHRAGGSFFADRSICRIQIEL